MPLRASIGPSDPIRPRFDSEHSRQIKNVCHRIHIVYSLYLHVISHPMEILDRQTIDNYADKNPVGDAYQHQEFWTKYHTTDHSALSDFADDNGIVEITTLRKIYIDDDGEFLKPLTGSSCWDKIRDNCGEDIPITDQPDIIPIAVAVMGKPSIAAYLRSAHGCWYYEIAGLLDVKKHTVEQYLSDLRNDRR